MHTFLGRQIWIYEATNKDNKTGEGTETRLNREVTKGKPKVGWKEMKWPQIQWPEEPGKIVIT